jgi:glycosyltransferase involved in cell wall biosynthesis
MSITVIINSYNKSEYIVRAINSVLAQKYLDFELICLDAGSTDGSLQLIANIKDVRFKWHAIENKGISAAKNFGAKLASYSIITFLDADDYWHPNFLLEIDFLSKSYPKADAFSTAYYKVSFSSSDAVVFPKNGIIHLEDFLYFRTSAWGIHTSSFAVKKKKFFEWGGFPLSLFSPRRRKSWLIDCNGLILADYRDYYWPGKSSKHLDDIAIPKSIKTIQDLELEVPGCGGEDQFLHDNAIINGRLAYSDKLLSHWSCDVPGQASTQRNSFIYPTLVILGLNKSKIDNSLATKYKKYYIYQLLVPMKELLFSCQYKNIVNILLGNNFFVFFRAQELLILPFILIWHYLNFKLKKTKFY